MIMLASGPTEALAWLLALVLGIALIVALCSQGDAVKVQRLQWRIKDLRNEVGRTQVCLKQILCNLDYAIEADDTAEARETKED